MKNLLFTHIMYTTKQIINKHSAFKGALTATAIWR